MANNPESPLDLLWNYVVDDEILLFKQNAEAAGVKLNLVKTPDVATLVGSYLKKDWKDLVIVGRGFNQPLASGDPTAHAEIVAIREAARRVGNYRLTGAALYVTIEPCLMCVGALVHARIGTLVFGALEPKMGAVTSTVRGAELPAHNHRFEIVSGVREAECRELMQEFFRQRR